jgi:hypothetical protein
MEFYRTFDHTILSDVPLPELPRTEAPADARIEVGSVPERSAATREEGGPVRYLHEQSLSYFDHPDVGRLLVTDGDTITVDPASDPTTEPVRQFLMGPGFRALLHQSGHFVLHASAVTIDGEAVAFVGRPDAGKSTLAAACYAEGHGVIADDIVVPLFGENGVRVPPGFPRVKLDPSAARTFDLPASDDAESGHWRYYTAERAFPETSVPLARVYFVEPAGDASIEDLPPGQRVLDILYETYTPYDETDTTAASEHFEQCTTLSRRVPIRKLHRPRTLAELPALVELIEDDCDTRRL